MYSDTLVPCRYPPLMKVPSLPTKIHNYLKVSDAKLQSDRDCVPTNRIAGLSSPSHNTSTTTSSALKLSKTARFVAVPATAKLKNKLYLQTERKQIQRYSVHGFATLVAEPTTCKQVMTSQHADS